MNSNLPVVELSDEYKKANPTLFKKRTVWMNLRRSIKFFFQRLFRGWDDRQTWCLDRCLADLIVPRLKRFKELTIGYPDRFDDVQSMENWQATLDKMIYAFEYYIHDKDDQFYEEGGKYSSDEYKKVEEGMALFAKYYGNLWW